MMRLRLSSTVTRMPLAISLAAPSGVRPVRSSLGRCSARSHRWVIRYRPLGGSERDAFFADRGGGGAVAHHGEEGGQLGECGDVDAITRKPGADRVEIGVGHAHP